MSSSSKASSSQSKHPFDVIVIISPDAQAAQAVQELIASPPAATVVAAPPSSCSNNANASIVMDNGLMIISTCDPFGCQLGSGGGTIAALAEADEAYRRWQNQNQLVTNKEAPVRVDDESPQSSPPTVLICHATGEESSRCPAQIAQGTLQMGTAWASLPVGLRNDNPSSTYNDDINSYAAAISQDLSFEKPIVSNPICMLMHSLSVIYSDIPRGSVVVVADSDIIISFNDSYHPTAQMKATIDDMRIDFENDLQGDNISCAVALSVPFPTRSIENQNRMHVLLESNPFIVHKKRWQIQPTSQILHELKQREHCWPGANNINNTGVVASPLSLSSPSPQTGETIIVRSRYMEFYMPDQPVLYMAQKCGDEMTWIDTGVIAFLPNAAKTLRELSRGTLKCCTKRGLKEMYEEKCCNGAEDGFVGKTTSMSMPTLEVFAKETCYNLCLYDDMLQALNTSSSRLAGMDHDYNLKGRGLPETLSEQLSEQLSQHKLYTCTIPTGSYAHLGNAGKLVNFMTMGVSLSMGPSLPTQVSWTTPAPIMQPIGCDDSELLISSATSGTSISSDSTSCAVIVHRPSPKPADKTNETIVRNCKLVVSGDGEPKIGNGSVLEHCKLECAGGIAIGERCLLSGVRGPVLVKEGSFFRVPSGICLQLFPLRCRSYSTYDTGFESATHNGHPFVCICLGVEDEVMAAPPKMLFGLKLQVVLDRSGLVEDDIWDVSIPLPKRTLWNAKINPILSWNDDGEVVHQLNFSFLDWISSLKDSHQKLDGYLTEEAILGLEQWRTARRLSLSEIGMFVDSAADAKYRSSISAPPLPRPINMVESHGRVSGELLQLSMTKHFWHSIDNNMRAI